MLWGRRLKSGTPGSTRNVTFVLVTALEALVATNRNWSPLMTEVATAMASAEVAVPAYGAASVRLTKSPAPPARRCHCRAGADGAVTVAENRTGRPGLIVASAG